ncbi:MAG: Type 1 glutamine amidotransferase-like domain-containing protein [Xanthomonadales bacterium]|nr:Type 1 glutamine amidotransferase-like domain-containing protein [Xanthomonadales bacterium]
MSVQVLLGPQTPRPNLAAAIDSLDFDGPIVSITAGWRDSEGEVEDIEADTGRSIEDLGLYQRAENFFAKEPEFLQLHRSRQDRLQELQNLYRIRLEPTLAAARQLLRSDGDPELLRLEQRAAISQIRALDRHHLRRISAIHGEFDAQRKEMDIPAATAEREAVWEQVKQAGLVLIAGGHVAVLLNRIRLFRLGALLRDKPIVAWSAGAMVLGERIVLFHDNAPQGKRSAEVLDAGLGIVEKLIPLPNAKSRLDWSSRTRMALFARRFAPSRCCTLDFGSLVRLEDGRVTAVAGSEVMNRDGRRKSLVAR